MGVDYYGVLSLRRDCSLLDIKNRYRKMALYLHPLRKSYPAYYPAPVITPPLVTWEQMSEAFDVLKDPLKRQIYDLLGEEGLKKSILTPGGYLPGYSYHRDPIKTYREFFGTASPYPDLLDAIQHVLPTYELPVGRGLKTKDKPLIKPIFLTLREIFYGGYKKMKIKRMVFVDEECVATELRDKVLNVPIKKGILPGTQIKFDSVGDQGPTIEPADVIFVVTDKPDKVFSRIGAHLIMTVDVGLKDALCGTSVTVNTLDNRVIRVPITNIVSPTYEKIVVKEGMPHEDNPTWKGDLVIKFNVIFPTYLPKASKQFIAKAFLAAEQQGGRVSSDKIHRMVLIDKMNRIAVDERLPKFND